MLWQEAYKETLRIPAPIIAVQLAASLCIGMLVGIERVDRRITSDADDNAVAREPADLTACCDGGEPVNDGQVHAD